MVTPRLAAHVVNHRTAACWSGRGELEDGWGRLHLLHGQPGIHQSSVTAHQSGQRVAQHSLSLTPRAGEGLPDVGQRQLHASRLQLRGWRPGRGPPGCWSPLPQEAHAVPPGLSRPQEDVQVLDEELLQPDSHVALVPTQVQVSFPQGVDDLLTLELKDVYCGCCVESMWKTRPGTSQQCWSAIFLPGHTDFWWGEWCWRKKQKEVGGVSSCGRRYTRRSGDVEPCRSATSNTFMCMKINKYFQILT